MLIKKDGKYSSQIYKKQGDFLERTQQTFVGLEDVFNTSLA